MDQATARRLLSEGAFFILLGVPEGTEFGIDLKSWNTGEKFRGVKMIPPGVHFIFYNSVSATTDDVAPRVGFFHNFKPGEVLVKKWSKVNEQISDEQVNESEIVSLKENLRALDGFLGPYPFDIAERWASLVGSITENLLGKLVPQCGQVRAALELQSCSDAERPRGAKRKKGEASEPSCSGIKNLSGCGELDLLPALKPIEGTELRLTKFPEKNYPEGSSPSEITQHSLDLTFVFETLLSQYSESTEIIGELEFCYICFLVGHSLEAFDQWKKLVTLFCSCDAAITKYRKLFDLFITVLEVHIKEIPEEFLADIVSNDNFVYVNLKKLFRSIHESNVDGQFKSKVVRFKNSLTTTFLWDFEHLDSDEDDEAPVIVET
ncbi:protein AAR2 homolog [Tribolium castaneum]|uniref:Protein AAR2 homolog n=1 Tax=Tribolium castaneum TaxID=7070 RepID=D6W9G5_TRICA|nr:PREDICTED: protein AAR2 homolog [Tribolium castaneum]EEZ98158.1 Protein AAR2 homolog-like Protein [Tribolium castaneum]|eukprot:XP_972058.1 PREDICTED: protein AAR2 homolog [Tribolium castaneum]